MTDAVQLVRDFLRRGIELRLDGDNIVIRPKSAVTPDLRAQLITSKHKVVAVLRGRPELGVSLGPLPSLEPVHAVALAGRSCYACRGRSWWRLRDTGCGQPGDWVCSLCHAPVVAEALIERCDTDGGAH